MGITTKQAAVWGVAALAGLATADAALAAGALDCDLTSDLPCTLTVAPDGGAGLALRAPGTQFSLSIDGSGFEVSGTVELLGSEGAASGYTLTEAALVVEYADPTNPEAGFRRLHGSAGMAIGAALGGETGLGLLQAEAEYSRRVNLGIELGSVLQGELQIAHLKPDRPCHGLEASDPGFRECPYWFFQYVEETTTGLGFGGTDLGLQLTASADATNKVLYVMDPDDFFVYVGMTQGSLDSITLNIESTAAEPDEDLGNSVDYGIGFSQHGYIPFEIANTYAIESYVEDLGANFDGHMVIDWVDLPIYAGVVKLDGSYVLRLPVDEVTGEAQWGTYQAAANGIINLKIPFFGAAVNWGMQLANASAGVRVDETQQSIYVSGEVGKEMPWKPDVLPLDLDLRNTYQGAFVLINEVDPNTAVPGVDVTRSFVQVEGEFLMDFSLGGQHGSFGAGLYTTGFLRADVGEGFTFRGALGRRGEATLLHPLIQADGEVRAMLHMDPWDYTDQLIELVGAFNLGSDTYSQEGILRITPQDAYVGFPLSFDPALVQQAYNDIQDATQDAEAEVNRLDAVIAHQRGIVAAEREAQQADLVAAEADLAGAQAEVDRLNALISKYNSDISYYKGRIKSWYNWYRKQPWYKKASAYATYLSKAAYYNGLIASRQVAIAGVVTARTVASLALDAASLSVQAARAALVLTPIDLDPRIAPVLVSRDAALAVLNGLQSVMPEIPTVPGTITATAGFRIDGGGLVAESRAEYCGSEGCFEIKGGTYDKAAGRACINLPEQGGMQVCTAIPPQA